MADLSDPAEGGASSIGIPDFECRGCGHGVFGDKPKRCIKCFGMLFHARKRVVPGEMQRAAEALLRIHRDADELLAVINRRSLRKNNRVRQELGRIKGASERAFRHIVSTNVEARQGLARSVADIGNGNVLGRDEQPSTAV